MMSTKAKAAIRIFIGIERATLALAVAFATVASTFSTVDV